MTIAAVIVVLTLGIATSQAQETGTAFARFVHVIPSAPTFDVFINGTLAAVELGYEEVTPFVALPAGSLELTAAVTGETEPVATQSITVEESEYYTLVISSAEPLSFDLYEDDFNTLGLGSTRFKLINAIANSEPIDFVAAGSNFASNFEYRADTNTSDIPANAYPMYASPADGSEEDAVWSEIVALTGRTTNTLVLYGTEDAPESLLLTTAVPVDGDAGFVRLAHGVSGTEEANVLIDGTPVASSLDYGESTPHLAIEPGSYEVSVQTADGTELAAGALEVEAGQAMTALVLAAEDAATITVIEDNIADVDPETAVVTVINTAGDSISVSLEDGTELAADLAVGEAAEAATLAPVASELTVTIGEGNVDTLTEVFYGGVYYNVFVLDDGSLSIAATSLSQILGSAPGAEEPAAVVEATPTEEVVVEATPAAEATVVPTQAPSPTEVTETEFPTARVALDAGANQQLREYPSAEARSLGLAPSGTILIVNGREGAPVDIDGNVIPLGTNTDGTPIEFVDPATLLTEGTDLTPQDTWLNATYNTPDGGSITAWVNAFTLDVRNTKGERQRLADLPTVPRNQPGGASNTSVTSPTGQEPVSAKAVATGLDEGVNLNIRRTPETGGEVLLGVATGTELDLVGIGESGEWAFVSYAPESGGTVTGWVSTTYVNYQFNGTTVDVAEMETRNLLQDVDEITLRGEIRAEAGAATATTDPFRNQVTGTVGGLNPDANLNLRRTPNISAEVIARLPNGTKMVVISKTESLDWFEVEVEGETGWVSSLYVSLSYNGITYSIDDVPVNTEVTNDSNLNETVVPPTATATTAPSS